MSLRDYKIGQQIVVKYDDDDFYGLVQGLMRLADSDNLAGLKRLFPAAWADLQARYNAPGGVLPGERA